MKVTTERCSSVCIGNLQKAIRKVIDRDYHNPLPEELYKHTEEELKKFSVIGQTFQYTSINNPLGGHRWFFLCPKCTRRVSKLFLPPEGCGKEHKYLCKECHDLQNQSEAMGASKIYKMVIKPLKRLQVIENKISRGHLTDEKVHSLLREHEKIENTLKSSPEYKVYIFKKKHDMLRV
jgi:hypothetical protein